MRAMCSYQSIMWQIVDNFVTDRMIDNSLIHKFRLSRKVRKRTKMLNAEIKKQCGVKNYKHYVKLKTSVLRNVVNDDDTSDSSCLTDVDYDIIYSSSSKQSKYVTKNFERYMFTSEEDCKEKNVKRKKKSTSRSTKRRVQSTKLSQSNTATSKKCIDIGWQEVKSSNKSSNTSHLRKRVHTSNVSNNEGTILEDNDRNHLKARSSKQSLSSQFDSQSSVVSNTMNSENKYTRQDHRDSDAMDNELSSENNTIFDKTKSTSKRKVRFKKEQNQKNQGATINESNTEFNSHDMHYQSSPSRSTSLEKSNDLGNELNSVGKSKAKNGDKSTATINKSSINVKNYDDSYVCYKPELLKNVKRNLTLALEKADSTNNDKDVETDKCIEDELNHNQLLLDIANFNRHSTPLKKTQTSILKMKELSPDALQDEQKDSGIDEGSQDRIDKIKGSNKIPSRNIKESTEKMPISSPRLKKINEVVETVEDSKEVAKDVHLKFNNDDTLREKISKEEKELSAGEMKNSSQLNQIDTNIETSQENEEDEHFVRAKDSSNIQKQQLLSPKQDCMKGDVLSEPCNLTQEEEDDKKVKKSAEEEEISLKLNKIDNAEIVAEISSINHEEKQDSKEENESSREERKNVLQLSQIDTDAEIHATNHENQIHFGKSEDSCDIQKQQLLLKIMSTEIVNKKYKIIDKKNNDVKSNIENIDNVNNNTDIEYNTPIKKNTLTHYSDVIDRKTDNWQETTVNREEIDTLLASETDNEEDNVNYMSPQTKKRLQQQARLNLVMSSDSSESNDEYLTTRTSPTHIYSSDTSKDDSLKNDESNCASQQTKVDISCSEDICTRKEATSVPVEIAKSDSMNMKEGIKKKAESLIKCTYENNDSLQSATNKNPLEHKQYSEDVHNDDESQDENFQSRVSESNLSCNSKESINQFRRHKRSSLFDKENVCTKSNQNEETESTEPETRCESEYEQSAQASTNCSNAHLNISCQYRPRNLQELIEDQKLLVETMPASFTLADLSEDEEAFILNVPSKVVQNSLKGQLLTLKEKSLKFNENKYRIVCKEVGTTSCIFATGKQHKPYKIVNIKKISTITLREKLPKHSRKSDVSNHYNTVSSEPKSKKKSRQREERNSKILKVPNHKKRKRIESSDSETEYLQTVKRKNDLFL